MPGSVIRLRDLPDDLRRVHGRIKRAAIRGMRLAARQAQGEVVREIGRVSPRPPIDTGEMRRVSSWPVTHIPEGAVLESATKQAVFMEYGTRPHTPPMAPLLEWAKRKSRGRERVPEGSVRHLARQARRWANAAKRHARRASQAAAGRLPGGGKAPLGGNAAKSSGPAAERAAKRRALREARKLKAAEALARRAWASIRRHGTKPRGFFRAAAKRFPRIVETRVRAELRKVSQ